MNKKILKPVVLVLLFMIMSCKSYTIPVDSFREQLIDSNSTNMNDATINNPLSLGTISYSTNNIDGIIVRDKDRQNKYLKNSPSLEIRVTHQNGKRYHMYFDTVILENGTLKGSRSRFIQSLNREIPMDSIIKIEVQDGGKKFKYQN